MDWCDSSVEHFLCKQEALNSNPSITKKKKKKDTEVVEQAQRPEFKSKYCQKMKRREKAKKARPGMVTHVYSPSY
jgi:hypothetical protein